jgi:hypothetical protein
MNSEAIGTANADLCQRAVSMITTQRERENITSEIFVEKRQSDFFFVANIISTVSPQWCLYEFATTLSRGNVLSFRLGRIQPRSKQQSSSFIGHPSSRCKREIEDEFELIIGHPKLFQSVLKALDLRHAKATVESDLSEVRKLFISLFPYFPFYFYFGTHCG